MTQDLREERISLLIKAEKHGLSEEELSRLSVLQKIIVYDSADFMECMYAYLLLNGVQIHDYTLHRERSENNV